jgi:hypothetical protein
VDVEDGIVRYMVVGGEMESGRAFRVASKLEKEANCGWYARLMQAVVPNVRDRQRQYC